MIDLRLTVPDYPLGAPCWLDVLVVDVPRAQAFYAELFGWQWRPGDDFTGGYSLALQDGHPVAGISRKPPRTPVPSQWTTYLRTNDASAAESVIEASGGHVMGSVAQLGGLGRSLIATDPGGAFMGLWEPGDLPGSGLLDAPGTLAWNELLTRDYAAVQHFHEALSGHRFEEHAEEGEPPWSVATTSDGSPAFGLSEIGPDFPDSIRSHWVVSFAAPDLVSTISRALTLGATLVMGPYDGPFGVGAVLTGPEGELFAVLNPDEN
ncbi:MAG: VOC family protein [Dermatophilaceae bacterium]